jgi:acyl-CoA thioester hydrolase
MCLILSGSSAWLGQTRLGLQRVEGRVRVWIEKLGRTSLTFGGRILAMDQDLDHARGSRTIVRVDPVTFKPVAWSDGFVERLAPWRADLQG